VPVFIAMSFVSPIFALLGLFAIAVPIVIHLLNRRRYKTVEWAAMTWLLAAAKQNRRRMRFEVSGLDELGG